MKPISIILVDDNTAFRRIAAAFLTTSYPDDIVLVGSAGSGEEALGLAERLQPEAVVADLVMPGLSGLELIARRREQRADIVLVALTFYDDQPHREAALAAGADVFVGKANLATELVPALLRAARSRRGQPAPSR